CLQYHSAPLTF
nr:immunoglobulin light chain junction region [Macaca mulatta]